MSFFCNNCNSIFKDETSSCAREGAHAKSAAEKRSTAVLWRRNKVERMCVVHPSRRPSPPARSKPSFTIRRRYYHIMILFQLYFFKEKAALIRGPCKGRVFWLDEFVRLFVFCCLIVVFWRLIVGLVCAVLCGMASCADSLHRYTVTTILRYDCTCMVHGRVYRFSGAEGNVLSGAGWMLARTYTIPIPSPLRILYLPHPLPVLFYTLLDLTIKYQPFQWSLD